MHQDVECYALNTIGSSSSLASQSVRVPAVYAFDPTNHVLIMEDIGTPPSLKDFISSLPGSAGSEKVISQVGELLGSYLARLHNWGLDVPSDGIGEDVLAVFRNNMVAKNVCAERTAGRLLATAKQFGIEWNKGEEIVQVMQREIKENDETFNMGDFWYVGLEWLEVSTILTPHTGQGIYLLNSKGILLGPSMFLIGNLRKWGQALQISDNSWERHIS